MVNEDQKALKGGFDSKLVRLKVPSGPQQARHDMNLFRFQTGSIKRRPTVQTKAASVRCFDSKLVRLKAYRTGLSK